MAKTLISQSPNSPSLKAGSDISKCRKPEDLPKEAVDYIRFIEKATECKIKYVSVGAEREDYIVMY